MPLSAFRVLETQGAYLLVSPYNMGAFRAHRVCPMLCVPLDHFQDVKNVIDLFAFGRYSL